MPNRLLIVAATIILGGALLFAIIFAGRAPAPQSSTAQTPHYATADFMNQPTSLQRGETTAQLLPVWRKYRHQKPTLLLLTNNPHLVELPAGVVPQVERLFATGSPAEILQASDRQQSNPLFFSASAADIALRNGWFGRLAWALPMRDPAQTLNLGKFREQLVTKQAVNTTEAAALSLNERVVAGQLRGVPFSAAALPLLQNISGPVVVHIDLSYFQPLYKNEIATPLLDILSNTLLTLKKLHLKTLAVTFSYGHLDERIALDVRFIGEVLAYLIEDPTRLEQDIPLNWQRQGEALYLENFFQKEKVRDIFLAQEQDDQKAAWIKYNLYKSAAGFNAGDAALAYLGQAVALDHLYALEYLELSNMAHEKQRPDEALRMLNLAAEAFPEDVQIKRQIAQLTAETGDKAKALQQVKELQQMEWSEAYYPEMKKSLEDFASLLVKGQE